MRNNIFLSVALVMLASSAFARPAFFASSTGAFDTSSSQLLATVTLEAQTSGTLPQTFGQVFPDGATMKPSTNVANSQTEVVATYPSGYARIVQVTVLPTLSAGVPFDVEIYSATAAEGADLTLADIDAAAPTASVLFASCSLGGSPTSSLASLDLTSPQEIWAQGPEMIEAIYRDTQCGLEINYYVRLYSDGRIRIRITPSNGYWDGTNTIHTDLTKTYTPTVTIGGTTVWDNGGATFTHYSWTGWDQVGWIGGDPAVEVIPDTSSMKASKMVPTYWGAPPSESRLNAISSTYTPGSIMTWKADMSGTGYDGGIGVIPEQAARCITSGGDPRACNSTIAHARAIASFSILQIDATTKETLLLSDWPTWTADGINGGGAGVNGLRTIGASPRKFEIAHHPSAVYVAYLLTADPYFYRLQRQIALAIYLSTSSGSGSGVNRIFKDQSRYRGWSVRSLGDMASSARPGDAIAGEFLTWLDINVSAQYASSQAPGMNDLGLFYLYFYSLRTDPGGGVDSAPFEDFYWMSSLGTVDQREVLADESDLHALLDHYFPYAIGFGGVGGASEYCYNIPSFYRVSVSDTEWTNIGSIFDTHKQIYDRTCTYSTACESPLTACSNTLRDAGSAGNVDQMHQGYYGYFFTALSYAAESNNPTVKANAEAAIARYMGATNCSVFAPLAAILSAWFIGDPALWTCTP